MHLPDHYLNPAVCAATAVSAAASLTWAGWKLRSSTSTATSAWAGMAAGIFSAQMVNFPVSPGTSGHLIGGALTAIVLGPWAAMFVMALVLAVQCLLFADGGLAALGANILNMGVVAPLVGYGIYQFLAGANSNSRVRRVSAAGVAASVSVWCAALLCSVELAASGTHPLWPTLVAMMTTHLPIGLAEGFMTAAVVAMVVPATISSGIARSAFETDLSRKAWVAFFAAILAVVVLSPFASELPDGLESAAHHLGVVEVAPGIPLTAFAADYGLAPLTSPALSTIVAGLIGLVVCAVLAYPLAGVFAFKPQR